MVGHMYKVLSKVLPNKLRKVIGSVIFNSQLAFINGRQILYSILITNKVVDDARKLKKELLLFKVDFEKAFNSVNWKYLETMMVKMKFIPFEGNGSWNVLLKLHLLF
jgi:hypothetical protein